MKKFTLILIALALIATCFVTSVAFAETDTPTEERDSVHFIAPTAMTVAGSHLFVADNIEDNKTALLCFKVNDDLSVDLVSTCEIDGVVSGLSNDGENTVYAIMGKSVTGITVQNGVAALTNVIYDGFENNVVGFVKGNYNGSATLFALTNNLLRRNNTTGAFGNATNDNWIDTKGCIALGDIVFYVYNSAANNGYYCSGYTSEGYILGNSLPITEPLGIVEYDGKVAFFSQHSILYVNDISMGYWTNNQEFQGNALETLISDTGDKTIADVAIKDNGDGNSTIFVLNEGINKIDVYTKQDNAYAVTDTIGSDMVSKTVPTKYTSYTLARPNGYPANIVYKTSDEQTSIEKIYTDVAEYKEYIILSYEGEENSRYYYVMIGDKFGWVKKSGGEQTTPSTDPTLTVIDTQFGDQTEETEAKFVSLNAVYVYDLPRESANQTTVTQSATARKTVKVLQKFVDGSKVWYLVRYDEEKTGFVKADAIGQFSTKPKDEPTSIEGDKKINSSLFAAVNLYVTKELTKGEESVDSDGNPVKLYSGDKVTVVRIEDKAAYVMILHSNGVKDFGWVEANRLIAPNQITTNAIVGLSLLGFAIVLAGTLVIVYLKRKKKIKANKD